MKVYNLDEYPLNYARTQSNLGAVYGLLAGIRDKEKNCQLAMKAFKIALEVITPAKYPVLNLKVRENLSIVLAFCADSSKATK